MSQSVLGLIFNKLFSSTNAVSFSTGMKAQGHFGNRRQLMILMEPLLAITKV